MGKQSYVIVRNLRPSPSVFGGHAANYINLKPFGDAKGEDSIKILLDEKNLQGAIRHYATLRKAGDFQIHFSEGIDESNIPDSANKTTVVSTAEVDQKLADRVAHLRTKAKLQSDADKSTAARLARAKAESTISENAGQPAAKPAKPAKAAAKAPEAPAAAGARSPVPGVEEEGVELTAENLGAMERTAVIEIATKLGVQVRPGASKGGLIKAILLKIGA